MVDYQKNARWVCDLETDGLDATRVWCFSALNIANPDERIFFGQDEVHLIPQFVEDAHLCVFHNGLGFDVPVLERLYHIHIPRSKIRDTLVMSRLADSTRSGHKKPHSIEAWAIRFGLHKQEHEDWSRYTPEMGERCKSDVWIGYLALKQILRELKGFSLESIQCEHDLADILQEMKTNGFWLDQQKALDLFVETKRIADHIERDIKNVFGLKPYAVREVSPKPTKDGGYSRAQTKCLGPALADKVGGPFTLVDFEEFNLDSPKQRVERLLSYGWEPKSFTETGAPRFDADELTPEDFQMLPKEAQLLGRYLMCRSRQRTAAQWLDLCDTNSYVHGDIIHLQAWSHRAAHRNPNMANVPAVVLDDDDKPVLGLGGGFGYECRDCWGADPRHHDEVLVGADLTAIQLRAFAHYAGDLNYINLVVDPSVDMHNVHAEYLGGVKRSAAKRWLYAFLLGAGDAKLGSLLGGNSRDGKAASALFMEKVPGVGVLKSSAIPRWAQQGWMTGLDGRRVPVMSKHLALTAALQSFEKCVVAHTMVTLRHSRNDFKYRAWPHDECQLTCHKDVAEEIGEQFKGTVKEVGERFGSLTPLTANYKVGKTWAETH